MSGSVTMVSGSLAEPKGHHRRLSDETSTVNTVVAVNNDVLLDLIDKRTNVELLSLVELRESFIYAVQVIGKLLNLVEKRSSKLEKLEKMVDVLAEKSEQNERQIELERNERKHQQVVIQELYLQRQLNVGVPLSQLSVLPQTKPGELSKEFWVLRSHQENLVCVTRPFICQIIRAAVEAGIVSDTVEKCMDSCPDRDRVAAFYKALLVRVGESPTILADFLQLMERELNQPIFAKMLKDIG